MLFQHNVGLNKVGIPCRVHRLDETMVGYMWVTILLISEHTEGSGSTYTMALQSFSFLSCIYMYAIEL